MKILKLNTKILSEIIVFSILLSFLAFAFGPTEALEVQIEELVYWTERTEYQVYDGSKIIFNLVIPSDIQVYDNSEAQNEVSIAVNPLNTSNIVVGFNDYTSGTWEPSYAYSVNNGTDWTYGGALPQGTLAWPPYCDPWLAFDNDGYLYYVALSNTPAGVNGEIFVCVAEPDDDGMVGPLGFSIPQIVDAGARPNDKPAIAVDKTGGTYDGNIYVVWARNTVGTVNSDGFRIFLRRGERTAETTAITWSAAQQVGPENFTQGAQVAIGPNGQVYVAYQNQSSAGLSTATSQLFSYSTDGGDTFTSGVFVSSVTSVNQYLSGPYAWARHASFPTLGVNPKTGTIFIAWADRRNGDDDILLSKSTDGGVSWLSSPVRVNTDTSGNGADQWHPALTVNSLGNIHIIFYDRRDDPNNEFTMLYHASSNDAGSTFSDSAMSDVATDPDLFTPNPSHSLGDYVGITSIGTSVYASWGDGRNANAAPKDFNSDVYFESLTEVSFKPYTTPLIAYLKELQRPIYIFEYPPTLPDPPPPPWPIHVSTRILPVGGFKGLVNLTAIGGYRPDGSLLDIDYTFEKSYGEPPFETDFTFTAKNAIEGINTVNILARFGEDAVVIPVEFLVTSTPYLLPEVTMTNPGEEIKLEGNGFTRDSVFDIFFDDKLLETGQTNADGKLSTTFRIPKDTQDGLHTIIVRDAEGIESSTSLRTPVMETESEREEPTYNGDGLLDDTLMILLILLVLAILIIIAIIIYLNRK